MGLDQINNDNLYANLTLSVKREIIFDSRKSQLKVLEKINNS